MNVVARRGAGLFATVVTVLTITSCKPDQIVGAGASSDPEGRQVVIDSIPRDFLIHIPRKVTSAHPLPLVIMLHGSGGTASDLRTTTGMNTIADSARFMVAYGQGTQGQFGGYPADWNAGLCCGEASREHVDDLAFIKEIISVAASEHTMDTKRVFVAGFSAGGFMAYHIGCQLPTVFAAIAVVSGGLADDLCRPSVPVAMIAIHGTSDPEVSFDYPPATDPPSAIPASAAELTPSMQFWVAADGCAKGKSTKSHPSASVTVNAYTGCSGADVTGYVIEGGIHGWPGLITNEPGTPMAELDASRTIAAFFSKHPHK